MINDSTQIMVVDDDKELRKLMSELLQRVGLQSILVKDGQTALTLLQEGLKPALIVLDLIMPGVDGFEVLARIRQIRNLDTVPVLILSALVDPEIIRRGLLGGADGYVTKPYLTHSLVDRVRVLIAAGRRPQAPTRMYTRTAPLVNLPPGLLAAPEPDRDEATTAG